MKKFVLGFLLLSTASLSWGEKALYCEAQKLQAFSWNNLNQAWQSSDGGGRRFIVKHIGTNFKVALSGKMFGNNTIILDCDACASSLTLAHSLGVQFQLRNNAFSIMKSEREHTMFAVGTCETF